MFTVNRHIIGLKRCSPVGDEFTAGLLHNFPWEGGWEKKRQYSTTLSPPHHHHHHHYYHQFQLPSP